MRRFIWVLGLLAVAAVVPVLPHGDVFAQEGGCGCGCAPEEGEEPVPPPEEEGGAEEQQQQPPTGPWEDENPVNRNWYQDKFAGELLDMILALDPPGDPTDANSLHGKIQAAVNLRKNNRFQWHGAREKPPSEDGPNQPMTAKQSWAKILVAYQLAAEADTDAKWQGVLDELDPGNAGINDANWAAGTKVTGPHTARWYLDKIVEGANKTPAQGGAGPVQRAQINQVAGLLLGNDPAYPKNVSHGVAWAKTVVAYYAQFPGQKNWHLAADELNHLD